MSLRILEDLDQGTEAWLDQRRGMVTASVVGQLVTPTLKVANNDYSRGLTATLAAERISGYTDPTYVNADMFRGIEDEPRARDAYAQQYGVTVDTVGFMVLETDAWTLGYSPDGLVGANGLIEIKSRRQKKQLQTILADEVPAENMAQLQAGLLVSGRGFIDYVSYCVGLPLYVKRVLPDERWFEAITAAVTAFEANVTEMVSAFRNATTGLPFTERVDPNIVELKLA